MKGTPAVCSPLRRRSRSDSQLHAEDGACRGSFSLAFGALLLQGQSRTAFSERRSCPACSSEIASPLLAPFLFVLVLFGRFSFILPSPFCPFSPPFVYYYYYY